MKNSNRIVLGLSLAGLLASAHAQTSVAQPIAVRYSVDKPFGVALAQVQTAPPASPGTGFFAPGKLYSILLAVAAPTKTTKGDYSTCAETTLGTYSVSAKSWLSVGVLAGFSWRYNAVDAGADAAYNFAGGHIGRIEIGLKVGADVLFTKGVKSGYGGLIGGYARF